jgi:tetratricopeptide (TPR) repeat protein
MSSRVRAPSFWPVLVICAATVAAYHNSLGGPFVFDDESSIVTNSTIRELWAWPGPLATPQENVTAQGRPVLNLSLAINYALHGTAPWGYHVGNLVIHGLAALAIFGIVRRTWEQISFEARGRGVEGVAVATLIAAAWAVHPMQTESVTYVIQRAESLVGLFYLLTLYCFARGAGAERAGAAWRAASVSAAFLGMATKEVMVTAPLMVLFYDRCFNAGTFVGALRRRPVYYAALASSWLLLAWLVAQTGGNRGGSVGFGVGVSAMDYWLTQFEAVAHYLWLAVWPHPLVFEYGTFWIREFGEIALPVVIVLGLLIATILALRRRPAIGFLGAWFFGILAPTSLAPGTTQMIVEHRMYLPLAAVIAGVVFAAMRVLRGRRMATIAAAVLSAGVMLTIARNEDYRSELGLWQDTLAKRPRNPLAHFMLAGAQERAGKVDEAIASYRRGLELKPDFSIGHESLGRLLLRQGRVEDAIAHLESAVRIQPQFGDAHANLGNAYLAAGRLTEALGHLQQAVALLPHSAAAHYNLGNARAAAGRGSEAIVAYQAALRIEPEHAEARFNLGNALLAEQRVEEAVEQFRAAVKVRPEYVSAHYNLANVLAASGRQAEAVEHYRAALQGRPDYPEAHHNLGSALFELGRHVEAAGHYEEALRLAPGFPNARENLARVRAHLK